MGLESPRHKYSDFGIYSMKKQGAGGNCFSSKLYISSCSAPSQAFVLAVKKIVYNYGLCWFK
jgi:hypothetical protein